MARFHDLVGQLRNPGEDGNTDPTIFDDLLTEYDTAMGGFQESDRQKDETISSLNGEVSRLKSRNYDLLTQVGFTDESSDEGEEDQPAITIDTLFTKIRR